jgi:hypothetical protein
MGHFKWCHINVMYGTPSPMIVPHKCCFIWLRHLSHLCISTTLKASGLGIIAIKLGLFKKPSYSNAWKVWINLCVMYYLFNFFNDYIIPLFGFIYLFIPNQLKILMKTSFEILDVAKWFQPSKIFFLGSRQQFVIWYLFIYLYFQWVTKKPI